MIKGEGSRPRTCVLALSGELDFKTANEGHKRLLELHPPRGGRLLVDLSAVTFMDSTGIRLLLQAREHARRNRATFAVVSGPDEVMRVIDLVGLREQLEIVAPGQGAAMPER